MSVIQILDSSKSNRAIYLVASAIICAALFNLIQIPIDLSIDSLTLYTTCVSGLALIVWASKLDIYIVELYGLWKLWNHNGTKQLQLRMANILLFVRPWEESLQEASTIEETLRVEYRRVIRGQDFADQVDTFHQIFWSILLSVPSFYLAASFLSQIGLWWVLIGIGVTSAIITPLWYRNRHILQRIMSYTLVLWFNETTSSGLQRREVMSPKFPADRKDVLEIITNMTTETMQLVVRKDWNGFERSSKNIESLVGSTIPDSISIEYVERYFKLLEWVISNNSPPWNTNIQLDRSIKNAGILIGDICTIYRKHYIGSIKEDEDLLIRILEGFSNHITDLNSLIESSLDVFALFDAESIKLLSQDSYRTLLYLPFSVQDFEKPSIDENIQEKKRWILALAQSLVEAAEGDLLDAKETLSLILSWGVTFWYVSENMGPASGKVLWEADLDLKKLSEVTIHGWGRTEIGAIAKPIASYIENIQLTEVESRIHTLEEKQDLTILIEYLVAISNNLPWSSPYRRDSTSPTIGDFLEEKVSILREKLGSQTE